MDNENKIINWLMEGDVSLQYQVYRDLLFTERTDLQNRIENEGWGAKFLSKRKNDGNWGLKFYQPKWTSTFYTLLDLRNICISPNNSLIKESIDIIIANEIGLDGGIDASIGGQSSDICVNGMFLNYACYFKADKEKLKSVIDFIISQCMPDGGFNCQWKRSGARHSSLHSTLSVLEGIAE